MDAFITTEYRINVNELKQIVKKYFEEKTNRKIELQDITFTVEHKPYCEPEFENVVITVEDIKPEV